MLRYIESITTENTSAWRKQLSKLLVQKLIANVYDYYSPQNARRDRSCIVFVLCCNYDFLQSSFFCVVSE